MLYERIAVLTGICAAITAVFGASAGSWNSEAREGIHHTFSSDKSGAKSLDVDDVDGSVQVVGDSGKTIRVEGEKIIRGVDQNAIERAKKEITLDVNEKDGVAQLYVNGPFRDHDRASQDHGFHIHFDGHEYEVTYNFTIHVPHDTELRLHTVNGEIRADATNGKFDVRNVNGGRGDGQDRERKDDRFVS
jgi:hypothetical protein